MTTFANSFTVGRVKQQNADEGVAVQSSNDVNVTVNAPDGTYYVKLKQKENEWWASDIARASVQVQNGKGTCSLDGSNLDGSKENWLEIGLQENGSFVKSGEVLRSEGKIYSVTESNHAFTVNEISIQPGTQRNFKDILGSATNFGIVANEATFKGHLESNFAIGKLNYEGSNVQMSKNEGGGAGYNYIGEFVGSSQLQIGLNGNAGGSVVYAGKGAEGKLTTDNSDLLIDYDTYTEAQIKKIVKDMVDTIKTTSTTLYNENSVPYSAVTDISTSGNQYTDINIAKYGKDAGTYYVSFQPGEFNTFMSNPNRRITIREDQNIVLNVPDTNVDFRQFTFVIVDASGNVVYQKTTNANSDEDRVAENVIFNCPNATTAATYTSTGIFLVPNATFTNALVSAGWVIANTIAAIGGQEWHNVYKGMPVVETTFQIKATKNVDNAPATDEKYDGKFSFELQEKNGENWKTIDSVTNTDSAIVFDNLGKFGTEGTHYYKIVETASALSDVTIDGEPVYVKAVIKKNGNKMVATVTYYSDENYATEVSDPSFNNTTVITEKTEVSVEKKWADNENQDRVRPGSIQVQLYADETAQGDPIELNEDNGWKYTWSNLEKKSGSNDIEYTVDEVSVPAGYTKTVTKESTGYVITNTHNPETTSINGTKTWSDNDNQDGKRPTSITVNLLANGTKVDSKEVTANDNWKYEFTNLPKYAAGNEITYTVEEDTVEGYEATVDGYNITNTHKPETTKVEGTKTWNDSDNQDGIRPEKIIVNLLADGNKVNTQEVTPDDNGNWTYSFTDLPKFKAGKEIVYTVAEKAVEGYVSTVSGYNINNTHKPETIAINGSKHWDDNDDQDGKRPESITVNLLANGEKVNSQVVTAAGNWTYNFTDQPKYKAGKEIKYRVEEVAVEGYTTELDGYDIYNTHTPETTIIEGTKSWNDKDNQDGKRPEKIIVNLLANGEKVDTQVVTADNDWKYSFKDLPVYKDGQKLTYTVSEETVKDYTTEYDGTNIINSYTPGKTSASVVKVWNDANNQDGKRPESITVSLLADGRDTGITVTLNAENNWTQTVTDLDEKANGKAIKYTWAEENVPKGYELTGNTTKGTLTTLTNKHVPEVTSISGTKTWNDNDNQDGKRPTSITVNLLADGTVYASQTVTAATNWKYTFDNLPVNKNGTAINYAIGEVEVTDYTTEIDEYDIINTHTPETTSVSGQKVWDDANNQDGKRPESIKVRLLANGTEVATKDVTAADNWAYNFTDLPKYANGEEIVYTVTEDTVADYTTAINGTTITNSYTPGKTSITVTKAWADNDNQDGIRPENIKVQLYAGETAQGEEVTLSADNNWTYTWSELDAKKDGQDIVYTVRETEVPAGYEAIVTGTAAEGFILTNTHETEVISVEGTKTWNDNDQTTKRPESITVRLLADGKEAGSQKVTADSNWTYKFAELPKYAAGKEIVYTVSEDAVPGYITSVNGNNLINTITSVKVSKVDITDHKELAGAHIQILDKDGNIIDEWDSTWEAHEVTGLKTNEQYTLRETVAPDGYTVTSDTTFTLKEDGTVDKDNTQTTVSDDGTLLVEDSKTSVKVSKVDIADGKELEGAHIQVIDEDENIVAEWDSTKEPHVIEGLKTDKKYILRETVAPTGYELTNDTTFVLKADGTVDTEKTTTVSKDGVLLVQDKLATGQSIAVTKKLTTITGDLRAMDQTFYVALYSDEACTQRVSDVKAIEFKNASSSTVVFNENIEVNKDYYIAECSQDGTAQSMGALADGTMYEAKFNNGNKATVKEANGTTTVYFDNVFSSIPDGYYKQGKLTITKKLLGADGNAKKSDNVFYAGIFDDADYTQLSTQVSQNIVKLDLAGGSEVSQVIKIGLDVNKTVTLYVTETDSNGKPVAGTSGFAYKVSVDGSTVTIDEANENASVTITNTENPTTTKTTKTTTEESGNESGSSASSHSMSSSTKAPKTGDDTPIAMYVIILIAAAALIVFGFEKRRRSNRK